MAGLKKGDTVSVITARTAALKGKVIEAYPDATAC